MLLRSILRIRSMSKGRRMPSPFCPSTLIAHTYINYHKNRAYCMFSHTSSNFTCYTMFHILAGCLQLLLLNFLPNYKLYT